jgi:hypothetical protein
MSLAIEQSDAAIRETFYNMEEGVEYVLNDFWWAEANRLRKEYGYPRIKNKQEHKFSRRGDKLFQGNIFLFDFAANNDLALTCDLAFDFVDAFSFSLSLYLAFDFALKNNGIEKLKSDTCEGKVVEIDGRKYKLTAV